jgi:hypothetical protein
MMPCLSIPPAGHATPASAGPHLYAPLDALPKLPEMHTRTAGEVPPDDSTLLCQTKRFRMSSNWTTLEELFRFPLTLRAIHPDEFRHPPPGLEILFTDRFGVTMLGVSQTSPCTHTASEHDICTRRICALHGYDQLLAAHGITYTDYRSMIAALLHIIYSNVDVKDGRINPILTGIKIKKVFRRRHSEFARHGRSRGGKVQEELQVQVQRAVVAAPPIRLTCEGKSGE